MPDYYMYTSAYTIKIYAFAGVRCCACARLLGVYVRVHPKP